jgi:hypothetical protein
MKNVTCNEGLRLKQKGELERVRVVSIGTSVSEVIYGKFPSDDRTGENI